MMVLWLDFAFNLCGLVLQCGVHTTDNRNGEKFLSTNDVQYPYRVHVFRFSFFR